MTQRRQPAYLTPEGHEELLRELEHLRTVRRGEVADIINQAKELGTTVNNAEYDDAKREQSFVEGRILELETVLKSAKVIPHSTGTNIQVGARVVLMTADGQEEHFTIVGSAEAHPLEGKISNESPVGKALMGRKVGDPVQVMTPGGVISYTIRSLE